MGRRDSESGRRLDTRQGTIPPAYNTLVIDLPMSISVAGLESGIGRPWARADGIVDARKAIEWAAALAPGRVRWIQLDATLGGIRPRELDRSGRRDLAAILRRAGLALSGLDLFIPAEHLTDSARVERAMNAVSGAAEMLGELAALMNSGADARRVVSLTLPNDEGTDVASQVGQLAHDHGVRVADHRVVGDEHSNAAADATGVVAGASESEHVGYGIDPASLLLAGKKPSQVVSRLGVAPLSARLSDANEFGRVAPGKGRLDRLEYFVALHTTHYDGSVIVDLRGVRDQEAAAVSAVEAVG